jgi:hypothetical protein
MTFFFLISETFNILTSKQNKIREYKFCSKEDFIMLSFLTYFLCCSTILNDARSLNLKRSYSFLYYFYLYSDSKLKFFSGADCPPDWSNDTLRRESSRSQTEAKPACQAKELLPGRCAGFDPLVHPSPIF